jgi:DNA-binding IscR family transcriptional regulator
MTAFREKAAMGCARSTGSPEHHAKGPLTAGQIADAEQIPESFLEAILLQLQRNGIVEKLARENGGYQLAAAPAI